MDIPIKVAHNFNIIKLRNQNISRLIRNNIVRTRTTVNCCSGLGLKSRCNLSPNARNPLASRYLLDLK